MGVGRWAGEDGGCGLGGWGVGGLGGWYADSGLGGWWGWWVGGLGVWVGRFDGCLVWT